MLRGHYKHGANHAPHHRGTAHHGGVIQHAGHTHYGTHGPHHHRGAHVPHPGARGKHHPQPVALH